MSHILIKHAHTLPRAEAKNLAQNVADKMKEEFSFEYNWQGDTLNFKRSGVQGTISVTDTEVAVEAKLGLLLSALKPKVESEINRFLKENFG